MSLETAPPQVETRPRPLFFVVLVLGLFITFTILLLITPSMLTETTLDKATNEVINKTGGKRFIRVAMLADAGLNEASAQVLKLVKSENCDMVIHSGDLDYQGILEKNHHRLVGLYQS